MSGLRLLSKLDDIPYTLLLLQQDITWEYIAHAQWLMFGISGCNQYQIHKKTDTSWRPEFIDTRWRVTFKPYFVYYFHSANAFQRQRGELVQLHYLFLGYCTNKQESELWGERNYLHYQFKTLKPPALFTGIVVI